MSIKNKDYYEIQKLYESISVKSPKKIKNKVIISEEGNTPINPPQSINKVDITQEEINQLIKRFQPLRFQYEKSKNFPALKGLTNVLIGLGQFSRAMAENVPVNNPPPSNNPTI